MGSGTGACAHQELNLGENLQAGWVYYSLWRENTLQGRAPACHQNHDETEQLPCGHQDRLRRLQTGFFFLCCIRFGRDGLGPMRRSRKRK